MTETPNAPGVAKWTVGLRRLGPALWAAPLAAVAWTVLTYAPPDAAQTNGGFAKDVSAAGYTAIIDNIFSAKGERWLRLDDSGDPNAPVVTLQPSVLRQHKEVLAFYNLSFLKADIRKNDPSLWRIENGAVVGIAENAHAVQLPFAKPDIWSGSIEYRDDPRAETTLVGGGRRIVLTPLSTDQLTDQAGVELEPFATSGRSQPEQRAPAVRLMVDRTPVAKIFRIGDSTPVVRLDSPAVRLVIEGAKLEVGEGQSAYARLDPGGQLVIQRLRDNRTAVVGITSDRSGISRQAPLGERVRDDQTASFALAVEGAMNVALARGAEGPSRISTTLDQETQARIQSSLEAYGESGRSRTETHEPFRSAVTVMDLSSGEILALASYPRTSDQTGAPTSLSPSYRRLVQTNHNFDRLSIGSAAKPIFISAILQQFPELRKLVLRGGYAQHDVDNLFGVSLDPPLNEDAMPGTIDFDTFLSQSSNRYAATMMLLAASRDPFATGDISTNEPYQLNGVRNRLPPLVFANSAPPGRPADLVARDSNFVALVSSPSGHAGAGQMAGWPQWLDALYDLPLYQDVANEDRDDDGSRALLGGHDYDLGVWRALATRLGRSGMRGFLATEASPERERLSMNVINNFRTDYINLVIGGGRSQWTTVKLAEIYGRLVSGRSVRTRLVKALDGRMIPADTPDSPPWNLDVRKALLQGMADVSIKGTAASVRMHKATARLQQQARERGETLNIYSKTGTPTLRGLVPVPAGLAIQDLFAAGLLRSVDEGAQIGVAAGPGNLIAPADGQSQANAATILAGSAPARAIIEQYRATPASVAAYLVRYNRAAPGGKSQWLTFKGGRLAAAPRTEKKADGRAYVMVLVRNDGAANEAPAGIVVAINIQQNWKVDRPDERGLNSHVAAVLGTELLEGALDRPLWLTDLHHQPGPQQAEHAP